MSSTIEDLQTAVTAFRDEREWLQFHNLKDLAMALSIEAGELCELFLWKREEETDAELMQNEFRQRVSEELADLQIYLLYISDVTGIPIVDAVRAKLTHNAEKYPATRSRGSAKKYDEI